MNISKLNRQTIGWVQTKLNAKEVYDIVHLAKKVDAIESKYKRKIEKEHEKVFNTVFDAIIEGRTPKIGKEFDNILAEHFFETTIEAIKSANHKVSRLAALPRSLRDIMAMWDLWRKKKEVPKRQQKQAESIKKAYIKKTQATWNKYRDEWETGKITKEEIKEKIKKSSGAPKARANTIIETENTRYWNDTRRKIYDQTPYITHYLYLPVRDHATTSWCYPGTKRDKNNIRGLRGRGRLVYSKDDPELKKICPSHWNCRSELVPLTPANPRHKLMIDDRSMARSTWQCVPLPIGWN